MSGTDAFRKLMILSSLAFGRQPDWEEVPVIGIDHLEPADIIDASKGDYRYRHVADIWKMKKGNYKATVGPALIGAESSDVSILTVSTMPSLLIQNILDR